MNINFFKLYARWFEGTLEEGPIRCRFLPARVLVIDVYGRAEEMSSISLGTSRHIPEMEFNI